MDLKSREQTSLYSVLGVKKTSSASEIRMAYRKLAMKYHPDKCCATPGAAEQAKLKFQEIQAAYSVLSDDSKRFLYDSGLYDEGEDEDEGMQSFMGEMASMMAAADDSVNASSSSLGELKDLFEQMIHCDLHIRTSNQDQMHHYSGEFESVFNSSFSIGRDSDHWPKQTVHKKNSRRRKPYDQGMKC